MIIIFIGPPSSGKGTQAKLLGKELNLPVFSMGALIREGYKNGDSKAIEGFKEYSMKGLNLPNSLKFHLLKERLDHSENGFILDDYPATWEDLETFNNYLSKKTLRIDKVFSITVSAKEMNMRLATRGRPDDNPEILAKRREMQDKDKIPVIEYFKQNNMLTEIDGEMTIDEVSQEIKDTLNDQN